MEVVFALLVLGFAFLLSFLASAAAASRAESDLKYPTGVNGEPPRTGSGVQADRLRRDRLRQTVEEEPDVVAATLKQWLRE